MGCQLVQLIKEIISLGFEHVHIGEKGIELPLGYNLKRKKLFTWILFIYLFILQTTDKQIRRCSPFLERSLLSSNGSLDSDEWKAVPDIWRSTADKYGDSIAVIDPYHDPPSKFTYKQVSLAIMCLLCKINCFLPHCFPLSLTRVKICLWVVFFLLTVRLENLHF